MKNLMLILLTSFIYISFSYSDSFDLLTSFKNKKIKIEGNNFAMMNFLSAQLSKLKITHFSTDSVKKSLDEIVKSQTGLTEKTDLQVGNLLVGDFTIAIQGTNPVTLKIINNKSAELQTVQYANENDFKNAFSPDSSSGGNANGISIKCPTLDNCFYKKPICVIATQKNSNIYGYYRFLVNHGDNTTYSSNDISDAKDYLDEMVKKNICVKEPFLTVSCRITTHEKSNEFGYNRYLVLHGENIAYGVNSLSDATKYNQKMIKAGICFDAYKNNLQSFLENPVNSPQIWVDEFNSPQNKFLSLNINDLPRDSELNKKTQSDDSRNNNLKLKSGSLGQ